MTSHLLTSILNQLSSCPSPFQGTSSSSSSNKQTKNLLLTLHCLFPNEFLLALDIIDRRLIRRYHYHYYDKRDEHDDEHDENAYSTEVFFVTTTTTTIPKRAYEVRLNAWNCTCPAFAMRAFQPLPPVEEDEEDDDNDNQSSDEPGREDDWFGGTLPRHDEKEKLPVCKHLLACVLAVKCAALFGRGIVEERVVQREELAGWCAGFA